MSGQKNNVDRGYDMVNVIAWFAARVDRILLIFDTNKIEISDELNSVINAISPFDEKVIRD